MSLKAKIYQPARTAMQSGKAKTNCWVLEYMQPKARYRDAIMGWNGTSQTLSQVHLPFDCLEDAISYASRHNIEYSVAPINKPKLVPKSYAANFSYHKPKG